MAFHGPPNNNIHPEDKTGPYTYTNSESLANFQLNIDDIKSHILFGDIKKAQYHRTYTSHRCYKCNKFFKAATNINVYWKTIECPHCGAK